MSSAADTDLVDYAQIDSLLDAAGLNGVNDILRAFWRSTDGLIASLTAEIAGMDLTSAGRTAHAIKGSAANVGANRLAAAARDIELCCRAADVIGAADALTRIASAYEQTRHALTARVEAAA